MTDMINHPAHYVKNGIVIEPYDFLKYLPFGHGNALKYIIRAFDKGNTLEDLKKAQWYLDNLISKDTLCFGCEEAEREFYILFRLFIERTKNPILSELQGFRCRPYDGISYELPKVLNEYIQKLELNV